MFVSGRKDLFGDNCKTIPVGQVHPDVERLLRVTEESLYLGLSQALHKKRVGDVSQAVQSCLLYTSPSPRDRQKSRMPSSA